MREDGLSLGSCWKMSRRGRKERKLPGSKGLKRFPLGERQTTPRKCDWDNLWILRAAGKISLSCSGVLVCLCGLQHLQSSPESFLSLAVKSYFVPFFLCPLLAIFPATLQPALTLHPSKLKATLTWEEHPKSRTHLWWRGCGKAIWGLLAQCVFSHAAEEEVALLCVPK